MAVEMQVSLDSCVRDKNYSNKQLDQVVLSFVTGLQSGQTVLKDL